MLTVQKIRSRGTWHQPYRTSVRAGCFVIPPIKLQCITDALLPTITNGEILTAIGIDETGPKPNTVHFEEKPGWWPAQYFELVTQAPISN